MKRKELEKRFYSFEIRSERSDDEMILTGRPVVYGTRTDLGYFDEIIEAGALNNTDLKDVRFLVNHNTQMIPLARSRNNNMNSTMKLSVDAEGLNLDWVKLDVERNATASELGSAVERGDLDGMSFMFSIDSERWENMESDHPTRVIEKIGSIVEISAVTFPAYPTTEIKTRCKETLENARLELENARKRNAGAPDGADQLELLKEKIKTMTL